MIRTAKEIAEPHVSALMADGKAASIHRWVLAQAIANAVKEAQKPLVAVREYAQKIYDDCEMPTTDPRESAMFYMARHFLELLDGEGGK